MSCGRINQFLRKIKLADFFGLPLICITIRNLCLFSVGEWCSIGNSCMDYRQLSYGLSGICALRWGKADCNNFAKFLLVFFFPLSSSSSCLFLLLVFLFSFPPSSICFLLLFVYFSTYSSFCLLLLLLLLVRASRGGRISAKTPNFWVFWVSMAEFVRNSESFYFAILGNFWPILGHKCHFWAIFGPF